MKLIIAYVQPEKLNDVKQRLFEKEVSKTSVTNAVGAVSSRGSRSTTAALKKSCTVSAIRLPSSEGPGEGRVRHQGQWSNR